jgi:flagellar FliL protein
MVDSTDDLNLDVDGDKAGGKGKLILIIAGVALLLLLTAGATLWFAGFFSATEGDETASPQAAPKAENPLYYPISQPFTVNLRGEEGQRARYLQAELTLMSYQQPALTAVETHMPVIRNNVNRLLARQDGQALLTEAARAQLQLDVVAEVNAVLEAQDVAAQVEDVYFTKLIMQ